ncbi:MAG: hypothetical protein ACYTFY_16300, partial [Planctomycetota bacterium]
AAVKNKASASAKIQVGCSHEVATIPFIPVPGNLYQKYKAMHEIGVSSVMQCWYFGNYPGLMNKAAGELSFTPFPESEADFLKQLCQPIWQNNTDTFVKAVQSFQDAYSNFPISLTFTHYGPLHHAVVWPLHLYPVDKPISPSWKFTFPLISGDRIGECISYQHTFEEVMELLDKMSAEWNKGIEILKKLEADYSSNRERKLDIGLCKAIGIQIESARNVYKFYKLREDLPFIDTDKQLTSLNEMKILAEKEISNSRALKELCSYDSRLGFHSEAEGYIYFADKLEWRAECIEKLLSSDFPRLTEEINNKADIFPAYTGKVVKGKYYNAPNSADNAEFENIGTGDYQWRSYHDNENIYFEIKGDFTGKQQALIHIEPCRLWPVKTFWYSKKEGAFQHSVQPAYDPEWDVEDKDNLLIYRIPFSFFDGYRKEGRPVRINIDADNNSWIEKHPWEGRLHFGSHNPEDLGWLFFS